MLGRHQYEKALYRAWRPVELYLMVKWRVLPAPATTNSAIWLSTINDRPNVHKLLNNGLYVFAEEFHGKCKVH